MWLSQGENDSGSGVLLNTVGFLSIMLPLGTVLDAVINDCGLCTFVHDCARVHIYD